MLPLGLVLLVLGPVGAAADGGPVRSFGTGGAASFAPARFSSGAGVAVDAQGRILVGATLDDGSLLHTRAAVLRLLPDGSLDPSFGSGGVATIAPPAPYVTSRAEAIALDAQGRIVVAGEVDDDVPAVARLLADGTLDPAFASAGLLIAKGAYGGLPGGWKSVVVTGSAIVLAGAVDGAPPFGTSLGRIAVVARIADDGRPDASFASGGFLRAADRGRHVRKHARHRHRSQRPHRARHLARDHRGVPRGRGRRGRPRHAAGALDGSFGNGGLAVLGPLQGRAPVVSVTGTGAIVALGAWTARTGGIASAARLRPSGTLDETFGASGELVAGATPTAGVLDCQGDLLVSGNDGVRRFGPDGRLDRTFRADRHPTCRGRWDERGAELRLAGVRLGRIDPPERRGRRRADRDRRRRSERHHRDRRRARRRELPDRRCEATHGDARLRRERAAASPARRSTIPSDAVSGASCSGSSASPAARCEAWNGRRFTALPCGRAAARLIDARLVHGAFRTPPLGSGRFIVRAVAIDGAGNRSRIAVRRVSR